MLPSNILLYRGHGFAAEIFRLTGSTEICVMYRTLSTRMTSKYILPISVQDLNIIWFLFESSSVRIDILYAVLTYIKCSQFLHRVSLSLKEVEIIIYSHCSTVVNEPSKVLLEIRYDIIPNTVESYGINE